MAPRRGCGGDAVPRGGAAPEEKHEEKIEEESAERPEGKPGEEVEGKPEEKPEERPAEEPEERPEEKLEAEPEEKLAAEPEEKLRPTCKWLSAKLLEKGRGLQGTCKQATGGASTASALTPTSKSSGRCGGTTARAEDVAGWARRFSWVPPLGGGTGRRDRCRCRGVLQHPGASRGRCAGGG